MRIVQEQILGDGQLDNGAAIRGQAVVVEGRVGAHVGECLHDEVLVLEGKLEARDKRRQLLVESKTRVSFYFFTIKQGE